MSDQALLHEARRPPEPPGGPEAEARRDNVWRKRGRLSRRVARGIKAALSGGEHSYAHGRSATCGDKARAGRASPPRCPISPRAAVTSREPGSLLAESRRTE